MAKRKLHLPAPRTPGKKRKPTAVLAWAGLVDGKLYQWLSGLYDVEHLSVFKTLADAKRCHEDVRRIRIEFLDR